MGFFSLLTAPLVGLAGAVVKEVGDWSRRRDTVRQARLEVDLARYKAEAELAVHKIKADMEWDLAWAGQAERSWKDEWLLILWSVPFVGILASAPFEHLRDDVMATLTFLQTLHPNVVEFYLTGWGLLFAATFGIKAAANAMVPGKVERVVAAFEKVGDDIPDSVADAAAKTVSAFVAKQRGNA